jgi:hypothetical protein
MQCFDEAVVLLDDTQVAWLISTQGELLWRLLSQLREILRSTYFVRRYVKHVQFFPIVHKNLTAVD